MVNHIIASVAVNTLRGSAKIIRSYSTTYHHHKSTDF